MNLSAATALLKKDPRLEEIIKSYSISFPSISTNLFQDLLDSIIGQQLSVKAASTITHRFKNIFANPQLISPQEILKIETPTLKSVGLSRQKISYLYSLSDAILSGTLNLETLPFLPDNEVIVNLTQVKGIGQWTAEMILIFSLAREDIFSLGDLGIRNAMSRVYGLDREDKNQMEKISQNWRPYRSLASLYLWQSLENKPDIVN